MVRFQGFGDVEFLHDLFALFHFSSTTLPFTDLFLCLMPFYLRGSVNRGDSVRPWMTAALVVNAYH